MQAAQISAPPQESVSLRGVVGPLVSLAAEAGAAVDAQAVEGEASSTGRADAGVSWTASSQSCISKTSSSPKTSSLPSRLARSVDSGARTEPAEVPATRGKGEDREREGAMVVGVAADDASVELPASPDRTPSATATLTRRRTRPALPTPSAMTESAARIEGGSGAASTVTTVLARGIEDVAYPRRSFSRATRFDVFR